MAAGWVVKPGEKYGPCVKACKHEDCKGSRETAACKCRHCGEAIGYERHYFDEWYDSDKSKGRYGYFVH